MKTFKATLIEHGACPEAISWVSGKTYEEAYSTCERADWMIWYFSENWYRPGFPAKKQVLLMACDCAELALEFVPEGEMRPAQAIAAARLAIEDPSEENLAAASAASYEASRVALSAAWYIASCAASYSASYAAWYAASYAALAGASQVKMCNLIRARIEVKP